MTAPKRIQLRRTKGWRKPPGAIVVARPSKWGNPFAVRQCSTPLCRADRLAVRHWHVYDPDAGAFGLSEPTKSVAAGVAVDWFHQAIYDESEWVPETDAIRTELAGRDLACWCPLDQPCHADVLLELANPEADN
jgi:hypothetical protein